MLNFIINESNKIEIDIYNMDESPFQVQYLNNTGQRVYTRRGSKQVWRKRGNQRKHVTLIGRVSAAGVALAPVLLWGNEKVRGTFSVVRLMLAKLSRIHCGMPPGPRAVLNFQIVLKPSPKNGFGTYKLRGGALTFWFLT